MARLDLEKTVYVCDGPDHLARREGLLSINNRCIRIESEKKLAGLTRRFVKAALRQLAPVIEA